MARLYSALLWRSPPVPPGFYLSDVVPDGETWIVREVEVLNLGRDSLVLQGFQLGDVEGAPIFAATIPYARVNQTYHLTTRQVLATGDQMTMQTGDLYWYWRISGYRLTAP